MSEHLVDEEDLLNEKINKKSLCLLNIHDRICGK